MQAIKRHKKIASISLAIIILLVILGVILTQNAPTTNPTTSPTPTLTSSPVPSQNPPTPTHISSTPITPRPIPSSTPQPTLIPTMLPGEIIQYQGQNLTLVNAYINYLIEHPDVAIAGTQFIDPATYKLPITGMVNNPINYTYDQVVNNFNSTLQVATLPCVEGWSVTLLWQGVLLSDLLEQTGVSADANTVIFFASDGYSSSLPLDYIRQNNIMVAYKMNNLTLTPQTGWPFFLVAKNQYGYKWVEWIIEINVSNNSDYLGYWESRGYPNDATVRDLNLIQPLISLPTVLPVVVAFAFAAGAVGGLVWWRIKKKKIKTKVLGEVEN